MIESLGLSDTLSEYFGGKVWRMRDIARGLMVHPQRAGPEVRAPMVGTGTDLDGILNVLQCAGEDVR